METIIVSAGEGSRVLDRQRVDDSIPASERREVRAERADVEQSKKAPDARKAPDAKEVARAAERLNVALQEFERDLSISVHEGTGQMVVQVTDGRGDVIRQIPPEQVLTAEVNIDKIVGLFVNDQA